MAGRDEIIKRIGRSPDWASAYLLALIDTPTWSDMDNSTAAGTVVNYDPMAAMDRQRQRA